ncbi:tetratricopeptide repeat protein [Nonomuraea rhodomycinica]|uniref:Tetratricopeptide repeat protein n=1 Tax=Nonomuraea rhodomycinica TaxID=1712872 RepID=A0A7Y6IJW7_9ACTN|nr:tetratricopeptide repeat protein [Nonomuraea rhodomycinica]NUW39521.1 tetratricopeptide repeat protein [Nonomuraea rhodomycinica]
MTATEPLLARAQLTAFFDQIPRHRLTVVTAGPGGGKTSAVRGWTRARPDRPVAWLTWADDATLVEEMCQALGAPAGWIRSAGLAAELAAAVSRPTVLVIDEVERIEPGTPGARLLEELCHHGGDDLHLVLISRSAVPFPIQRLRGLGHVFQVSAEHLAFTPAETRSLTSIVLGSHDLAEEVHELTEGWPVAVRLTLSWLSGLPSSDRARRIAATPLFDYLVEEVVKDEHEEFLRATARLPWFTYELCRAMGVAVSREELRALAAQHILIMPCDQGYVVSTLVREFMGDVGRTSVAAHWYESQGFVREALAVCEDPGHRVAMIERWHASLLAEGHAAELVRACAAVPEGSRTCAVDLAEGQARQVQGDWAGALECLGRADATDPAVAWRMGMIHYQRGDYKTALSTFERAGGFDGSAFPLPASRSPSSRSSDRAMLLAWSASARWLVGESAEATRLAEQALAMATLCTDERAAACAHTALAMVTHDAGDGAGSERHSALALAAAESSGDLLLSARVLANRAASRVEEARYEEAIADSDLSVRRADLVGAPVSAAIALHNRAEALMGLGRLDEALADFQRARDIFSRVGSDKLGHPLAGLGKVHLERGELMHARISFENSLKHAEQLQNAHLTQTALAGLARVHAVDDPASAVRLAERAVAAGGGSSRVDALLAAGWVWAEAGDRTKAGAYTRSAREAAVGRRDRAMMAEALELSAFTVAESAGERADLLASAAEIWAQIGSPVGLARNAFARARLTGSGVHEAEQELRRVGIRGPHSSGAGLVRAITLLDHGAARFCMLGAVRLSRRGSAVEWQSRKARDLLTWLACQRGRAVAREAAMEILWPGEDPASCSNRLSVALSTVRSVLDPQRKFGPGEFVRADKYSIQLVGLRTDVEEFLCAAAEALASQDEELLVAAEARYTGDVCEDSPYAEWLEPLREEARAVHQALLRELASRAEKDDDPDRAVRYLLRLLERDAYDEAAHLDLVRTLTGARRHGEARRRYRLYAEAMRELDVEPAPLSL